ncbi:colicin immunity domain-containing protein [Luteibacter aegosomatissinici]|uniref:colicin immunity domain-containing protein n=1 Tax=Luteibacter aegosomatissinici TaxID=2911539 RepID=UPI001FFA59BC|nr:colicin immunity domain-containing protein [Luteibacter aegosomatissinici]UPG94220.1 colicin immunity domain-containing protein [Luteibacter aegosomatissinici]
MNLTLLRFAESFSIGRISASAFAEAYVELWRIERGLGLLTADEWGTSEKLSSLFVVSDLYSGDEDRLDYELDEWALLSEVLKILEA